MWVARAAKEVDLTDFKASRSWLLRMKRSSRTVSRKITEFVSRAQLVDKDTIVASASSFVSDTKPLIEEAGKQNAWNSDQTGITLEMHSGRTLDYRGE